MSSGSAAILTEAENPNYQNALATDADLPKTSESSSEHGDNEEEEDIDFNPLLKETPSLEASSSLSSEIEGLDDNVVDSVGPDEMTILSSGLEEGKSGLNSRPENETVSEKDIGSSSGTEVLNDVVVGPKPNADTDEEDAICKRTRARYSLASFTLDELETFLQETDDEEDLQNVDDEEEYRKFLAAVLHDGDTDNLVEQENENIDDEDEDNDADFELEIEEALESDVDENIMGQAQDYVGGGRRPETRQNKRKKASDQLKDYNNSWQLNRPLRPLLPSVPVLSLPAAPQCVPSSVYDNGFVNGFTPHQLGQLHCLIHEHLQLLIQVYTLCVFEPSKEHIAAQVQGLISEMLHKRNQVVSWRRVNGHALSVLDVAPLKIVGSYMEDVSSAVQEYKRRHVGDTCDDLFDKEPLFPFNVEPSSESDEGPKKTLAGILVERTKKQSVAPVPKKIAKLSQSFFPLFNPALFPHKPPPASLVNRLLFTDAEDMLLAMGLMEYNSDWKAIQQRFLPCKSKHQIFVRQKNRSCSRAPENPIKAVRRIKNSSLTAEEIARIREGLKNFKLDWMSVWKYIVPYRDPSLLPRQWRIAIGTQKSYKADEHRKEVRRLYESNRRKRKPADPQKWQSSSEKEDSSGGGEHNSGDDCKDNENEAYVHEAFLADWRPGTSSVSLDPPVSNSGVKTLPSYLVPQVGPHSNEQTNTIASADLNRQLDHQVSASSNHPQLPVASTSSQPNNPLHDTSLKSLKSQPYLPPYRARKTNNSRLVKLAPDLPPVNLPSSVRVMSQSAFKNYQGRASNTSGPAKPNNTAPKLHYVSTSATCNATKVGQDHNSPVKSSTSDLHAKDGSDLHMHPLLFQPPEDGRLPYYPLNCSASASSSFNFFPRNQPPLNLNLFHNPKQANYTVNPFDKSKEKSSLSFGIDFHPLLQRSEDVNSNLVTTHRSELLGAQHTHRQDPFAIPSSPNQKANELDLNQPSVSYPRDVLDGTSNEIDSGPHTLDRPNIDVNTEDQSLPEIVMEQEELSDSEEEVGEHVEFECEEMDDSEGEEGSDCEPSVATEVEEAPNVAVDKVVRDADCDDQQHGPRPVCNSSSSLSFNLNSRPLPDPKIMKPKNSAVRNPRGSAGKNYVEFECEEMVDTEGEEGSDCERIGTKEIEELPNIALDKEARDADCDDQPHEPRHLSKPVNVGFRPKGITLKLGTKDQEKSNPSSPLCLNLNSSPPPDSRFLKAKRSVIRNSRGSAGKIQVTPHLNRSSKNSATSAKLVGVNPAREPRKRARKADSSL